ncbi:MAG: hypothetical protein K6A36_00310 [Paludibacteraceae bacterium]|nr:hypothetical protein [Paludibacteraceae bacterium]
MKKNFILFATAMMVAGCGFTRNATTSTPAEQPARGDQPVTTTAAPTVTSANAASSAGQGAGNAMLALYNQYKADGNKYDYKNMQNILNTVTLLANCEGLKENYQDKTYLGEFSKGLIASSLGLVTKDNVETVTNSLVDMVKNSDTVKNTTTQVQSTANTAAQYANTAAQYATSIGTLLSLFGGNK